MSSNALIWAASIAPVADVQEYAVLVRMADTVDEYGCGCLLSTKSLARDLKISEKTVQRRLDALEERNLIGRGDQRKAEYIRADRRPTVYDLLIPAECFASIERTNERRQDVGLAPLTPENRPKQDPPGADAGRSRRSDVGKKRVSKAQDGAEASRKVDDEQALHGTGGGADEPPPEQEKQDGGTTSHPVTGGLLVQDGGTTSPGRGDYQSPKTVLELDPGFELLNPEKNPPLPPAPAPASPAVKVEPGGEFDPILKTAALEAELVRDHARGWDWLRVYGVGERAVKNGADRGLVASTLVELARELRETAHPGRLPIRLAEKARSSSVKSSGGSGSIMPNRERCRTHPTEVAEACGLCRGDRKGIREEPPAPHPEESAGIAGAELARLIANRVGRASKMSRGVPVQPGVRKRSEVSA